MVKYSKVNVKLSDTQLKKLKTAVKDKTGTTLRMSFKMFNRNDLPRELLLTTRQKIKLRNAFNNNMSTDLKLSKAQISKIIQSGGFLGKKTKFKKQIHGSETTILIILNEEMNDIMKIVQVLEDSNILLKGVTKTIKNETKKTKRRVFKIL